ncbi:MAG TPA: acetate kinase, partial [Succinivibrionaceae bacterium]|nr:acetate kinase [Succinivibrionaceae bacterium]
IDPSVIFFLCDRLKMTPEEVKDVFNKESGLKALSGVSSDMRPIEKAYSDKSDDKCVFAFEAFIYRLAKFIASYYIPLGHVDGIVFAGGIGENSEHVRRDACDLLKEPFGVEIDNDKNNDALAFKGAGPSVISKPSSKVTVMMIPTNEELVIARSAMKFVK